MCRASPDGGLSRFSCKIFGRSARGRRELTHRDRGTSAAVAPPSMMEEGHMALYEHVLIARQDISAQQAEALNDQLKSLIEEQGGTVAKIEYWGLRNLTYRIKKNRKGHYSLLAIDAPAPAVKEMERQLSINEDVLRYLTVKVEELDLELSPILARRDRERERERPRNPYEDVAAA
jgi:small subunit ribosomal protein S6